MLRIASRLSLILLAYFCFQPFGLAQETAPTVETALRGIAEEFFSAYAKEDLEKFIGLWSVKSPELQSQRKVMQELFAAHTRIEVKTLTISKVKVESEKASVRVAIEITALDVKTGKPAGGFGKMNRAVQFVKEEGAWKVWHEAAAEENLAAVLVAAKTEEQRAAMLVGEPELVTVALQKALAKQGQLRMVQGDYPKALISYALAQRVAEQLGDQAGVAKALQRTAVINYRQGKYDISFDYLQKSLKLSEALGDQAEVASTLVNFGILYYLQSKHGLALEYYRKSLTLNEALGKKAEIATSLTGIGIIHFWQGNYDLALDYYQRALVLREEVGNRMGIAYALNNLGGIHQVRGNFGLALEHYQKSLTIKEQEGARADLIYTLRNIGLIYQWQGNHMLALEYYYKGLKLAEEQSDGASTALVTADIGNIHLAQGNHHKALEHYQRSQGIWDALGNKEKLSSGLDRIGRVYEALGDYAQALEYYRRSLSLSKELELKPGIAETLNDIAIVQNLQGHHALALESAEGAADMARRIGRPRELWSALVMAGRAYRALNQPVQARRAFEEAIATVEGLRGQVAGGEQEQQRFFENKVSPYQLMVGLLVEQNHPGEALTFGERSKARVLLDVLRSGRVNITKAMTAQEQEWERRLAGELVSINSEIQRENLRPQLDQTRLDDLKARLQKARLEYEAFQTSLYATHPELRVQRGETPSVTLAEAAELLPEPQSVLLEYVVTDEKTYLFVLSKRNGNKQGAVNLKAYTLPIKQKELADHVAAFRRQLAKRDLTFRLAASKLYDLLLKPAQAELQGKQTLVIVPDGALWELPFQALQSARGRYLVEDHALSYTPSLTVLREMLKLRRRKADDRATSTTLLAIGNPALGKETVGRVKVIHRDEELGPLPEAEREVKTLGQLYGAARSQVYVGAEAREDRVKAEAGRFGVLHLATHGILNDASPMYSQVVLAQSAGDASEDGLLEAWEIMKLDLKADLVVLSACETGRGRVGAGEGVIGLTWALFVAGSPTTVVSQWKVESASTTRLMLEFHRSLQSKTKRSHVSTAKALQGAAVKMLRSAEYRHPFYWAGFVVVGDGG